MIFKGFGRKSELPAMGPAMQRACADLGMRKSVLSSSPAYKDKVQASQRGEDGFQPPKFDDSACRGA
jgi:hypothetical protein